MKKIANIPKDFTDIGGGFYKKAHEVWQLIEASGDEKKPFTLIRVKSEKKFEPEAGPNKQAGMKRTASVISRARVFRAGNLVEVTVRTDDGDKAEVEHDDGVIEILPSTMVHDAEPSIENMQMIPEDCDANLGQPKPVIEPSSKEGSDNINPGHGKVNFTTAKYNSSVKKKASWNDLATASELKALISKAVDGITYKDHGFSNGQVLDTKVSIVAYSPRHVSIRWLNEKDRGEIDLLTGGTPEYQTSGNVVSSIPQAIAIMGLESSPHAKS